MNKKTEQEIRQALFEVYEFVKEKRNRLHKIEDKLMNAIYELDVIIKEYEDSK